MRLAHISVVLCCGLLAQTPHALSDIRTIFVDNLGQGKWPTIIREKIINRIESSGRFQVVVDPAKADAILTGSVGESIRFSNASGSATNYVATAAVRLVSKGQALLWVSETRNNRFARSASSSVADRIVKDLLNAAELPKKK